MPSARCNAVLCVCKGTVLSVYAVGRLLGDEWVNDGDIRHNNGRELAYRYALARARLTERGDDPPLDRLTALAAQATSGSMTTLAVITDEGHLVKSASGRWPAWKDAWQLPLS